MAVPCALIASCTDINPREIVKQMLSRETLPTGEHVMEEIEAYPWHIDTKYYTADVRLCVTDRRTIGDETFAESVQAFILIFDSKEETSFEQVNSWLPFAKEIDAAVEMLVCKRCDTDDAISKAKVQGWCLKNSFEFVELDPETFSDEEEDDFPETTGVKRIIQALHAHMWPNLEMKESPSFRSPYMNQMMANEAEQKRTNTDNREEEEGKSAVTAEQLQADVTTTGTSTVRATNSTSANSRETLSDEPAGATAALPPALPPVVAPSSPQDGASQAVAATPGTTTKPKAKALAKASTGSANPSKEEKERANRQQAASQEASKDPIDSLINNDDLALFSALGNDEASEESFEQLFEKMALMKQRAENLPPEQRRAYAEKVAVTFWRAIGGDEDEIDCLSDDDP